MVWVLVLFAAVVLGSVHHSRVGTVAIGDGDPQCTGRLSSRFEGAEHRCLAQGADLLTLVDVSQTLNLTMIDLPIWNVTFMGLSNNTLGTFGDIVAMAGDFFAPNTLNELICTESQEATANFMNAVATLDSAPQQAIVLIRREFDEELAALRRNDTAIVWQVYRQFSFAKFIFELATSVFPSFANDVYQRLLANFDHFGNCARRAYWVGHSEAMRVARLAGETVRAKLNTSLSDQERSAAILMSAQTLKRAYLLDAFAAHFGSDLFSGGHLQTPRAELFNLCGGNAGGLLANYQHDESNRNGVLSVNALGDRWTVYGDGSFFDIRNSDSIRIARQAIHESRREILDAFLGGPVRSVNESGLLLRVPVADMGNPNLPCPLFRIVNGSLQIRNDVLRPENWVPGAIPPFDSSIPICPPVPEGTGSVCSFSPMNNTHCPRAVELLFAKQSFLNPAQFGARVMCYDTVQRAYVNRYLEVPLSGGQIAAIVVCSLIGAALLTLAVVAVVFKCYRKAQSPNVDVPL